MGGFFSWSFLSKKISTNSKPTKKVYVIVYTTIVYNIKF